MISGNLSTYFGKPVKDFAKPGDIKDFSQTAPRVRVGWDDEETCADRLSALLDESGVEATEALVIGSWFGEDSETPPTELLEVLVSSKDKLPNLKALFFGDIVSEENEMSWITQDDLSALWGAFPKLEDFTARGANGLRLGKINHANLKRLAIETGGMPSNLLREALDANAPLEHFEVWLGSSDYGANTSPTDLAELRAGNLFPNLKTLALRNCDYADDLAEAIAVAPILDRIAHLDLSMGTLTDRGGKALVAGGKLGQLESLDISHHFLSDAVLAELKMATRKLIADEQLTPDTYGDETYYYIGVSE